MAGYFRAVAIDYDGTLTDGGRRPPDTLLEQLGQARAAGGLRLILVTGRILAELREVFPDFDAHFDTVVAENGAVLHGDGMSRAVTGPVPFALDEQLVKRSIPFRRGQVLLACSGLHDVAVLEELRALGLDCQIVRNRTQIMIVPAAITKGTGLVEALAELGISRHSAIAVGDAENDHALLESCELGVAVASAVPSVKERADIVLAQPNGAGVASFLSGPLLRDELLVEPRRWRVDLGVSSRGDAVGIPGSRVNLLITGGSGSGKSYAAGLFAERLINLGYSVCVFDPEGDHVPLGRLRGVVVVGGPERLPAPSQLVALLARGLGSVVVDLSLHGEDRVAYIGAALTALEKLRVEHGLPHWIVVDEAHAPLGTDGGACSSFDPARRGYCLVTYRPMDLCGGARGSFDFLLVLLGDDGIDAGIREDVSALAGLPAHALAPEQTGSGEGRALLIRLGPRVEVRAFSFARRWLTHVRHWHKYAASVLPPSQRFFFRSAAGLTGAAAANLTELHHEIRRCGADVIAHHARGLDLSRWLREVIQDSTLAESVRALEARAADGGGDVEALRSAILEAIEARYLA